MEIRIKMPFCISPRLIDIRVAKGDEISLGDILFSYESDGALMFEYSASRGIVTEVSAAVGREIRSGDRILTLIGAPTNKDGELFPSRER